MSLTVIQYKEIKLHAILLLSITFDVVEVFNVVGAKMWIIVGRGGEGRGAGAYTFPKALV